MRHESSDQLRRLSGLSGIAGALLFFVGTCCFTGILDPAQGLRTGCLRPWCAHRQGVSFSEAWSDRLPHACASLVSGMCTSRSPIGDSRRTPDARSLLRIDGGRECRAYALGCEGLGAQIRYGAGAPCSDLLANIKSYWALAYNLGAILGYIGAVLLVALIVLGRTWYPRWTVITNPAVLLALSPFADQVPSPFGAILVGGFTNLSIAAFFLLSVLTTWHRHDSA